MEIDGSTVVMRKKMILSFDREIVKIAQTVLINPHKIGYQSQIDED
jgi:hypothetical protein